MLASHLCDIKDVASSSSVLTFNGSKDCSMQRGVAAYMQRGSVLSGFVQLCHLLSTGDDIVEKKKALPKGWGNRKTLNDHLRNRSFDLEQVVVRVLSREHTNLVALVGFCDKKSSEIIFVYVYVASGDLVDKMRKHLNAIQRLEICLGAAREPNETIVEACPIEDDNGVTVESNVPENEPEGAINILRTASKTTTVSGSSLSVGVFLQDGKMRRFEAGRDYLLGMYCGIE
ncbi:tyrosine-protein kinase, non-receptor Jak2 [Tanacetum coccineum]